MAIVIVVVLARNAIREAEYYLVIDIHREAIGSYVTDPLQY
jgi:hypothetical protein